MSFSASYIYKLRDEMSPVLRKISGSSSKMATEIQSHAQKISQGLDKASKGMKDVGGKMTVAGGAITAPLALATREAMKFNKGVAELSTLMPGKELGAVKAEFNDMLLSVSSEFGKSADDVVKSAYQAVSAGVAPTRQAVEEFLRVSAQASIGGITEMETAVDGISSVLNAYGADVISAKEISDKMFTAVRLGKTTFNELADSLYNVIPSASAIGIKLDDVTGALAVMTAKGTPTKVATTQLRAMFNELSKSSTTVSKVFKKVSGESFNDFIKNGGNVQEAISLINDFADKNKVKMVDIFSSIEAGAGALNLGGKNAKGYAMAIDEMRKSADATQVAFEKMRLDESFRFEQATSNIKTTAIAVGTMLLPAVSKLFNLTANGLQYIQNWINANPKLAQSIIMLTAGLGATLTVGGTFLMMLGVMASGVVALGKAFVGIKIALAVMKTAFIKTTVFLLTNPIGWLILGIAGIVASIYLLWKHWDKVKTWISGAIDWIVSGIIRWKNLIGIIAMIIMPSLIPFVVVALLIRKHWDKVIAVFDWFKEKLKIIGDYWAEVFDFPIIEFWKTAFSDAIDYVVDKIEWLWSWIQKIPDGLDWINNKIGKVFKSLGLDKILGLNIEETAKPAPEMMQSMNKIQQSQIKPNDFYSMSDIFEEKTPGKDLTSKAGIDKIEPQKNKVDVNVKTDVGGELKIKIENGKVKEVAKKQNSNLGFQVGE